MKSVSARINNYSQEPNRAGEGIAVIDGWPINVANQAAAVREAVGATLAKRPTALFTLNLDHVVKLRQSSQFRSAYKRATIITADGAPIVWLARRDGKTLKRTTGADLVGPLARAAAVRKMPIALFGTTTEVLDRAAAELKARTPGTLDVAFIESPPMGFDAAGADADAALDRIVASGARIVFLALGAPKQEVLAARAMERQLPLTIACIGAGLDFIAGAQKRAPRLVQALAMEWAWRLATNPKRMFMRYAACAGVLFDLAAVRPARQRLADMRGSLTKAADTGKN